VSDSPMRRMRQPLSPRRLLATLASVALLLAAQIGRADGDAERETLARLIHELEAAGALIDTAEGQANPDARIRFRYDWLRQDLKRVRQGIEAHIDAPRVEPRRFPPLRGDYRR